jgi:8-oxo-dGTP diphosphatase
MSANERTYPTFPIPAVGAVILNDHHVLLIQRGQAPAKGKWTLPGGVIELGESPEEALIREVEEECSLIITVVGIIDAVNRVIRDDHNVIKYHYVILDYLARCQPAESWHEASLQPGTDVMNVRWVPLPEVSRYDLTDGLLKIIHAGIAMEKQFIHT